MTEKVGVRFRVKENGIVVDRKLGCACLATSSEWGSLPNDFVLKILLPKHLIEHGFYVVSFLCVEVDVNAAVVGEEFAKKHEPAAEELNKLRAEDFVAVGLLFVLHEVLARGKGRVDVDELDFPARAEAIRSPLIGQ